MKFFKPQMLEPYSASSDGTKGCFMFCNDDKVDDFVSKLNKRIGDVTRDTFLGYKTIYVPLDKYKEAIVEGLDIIFNDENYDSSDLHLLDCYNQRSSCGYAQILYMAVDKSDVNEEGYIEGATMREVAKWLQNLRNILGGKIEVQENVGYVEFFVKRKTVSEHEEILNKIRNCPDLFENTPFGKYALIDYYGEFIEL